MSADDDDTKWVIEKEADVNCSTSSDSQFNSTGITEATNETIDNGTNYIEISQSEVNQINPVKESKEKETTSQNITQVLQFEVRPPQTDLRNVKNAEDRNERKILEQKITNEPKENESKSVNVVKDDKKKDESRIFPGTVEEYQDFNIRMQLFDENLARKSLFERTFGSLQVIQDLTVAVMSPDARSLVANASGISVGEVPADLDDNFGIRGAAYQSFAEQLAARNKDLETVTAAKDAAVQAKNDLQVQLDQVITERDAVTAQMNQLETDLDAANEQVNDLTNHQVNADQEIAHLTAERDGLQLERNQLFEERTDLTIRNGDFNAQNNILRQTIADFQIQVTNLNNQRNNLLQEVADVTLARNNLQQLLNDANNEIANLNDQLDDLAGSTDDDDGNANIDGDGNDANDGDNLQEGDNQVIQDGNALPQQPIPAIQQPNVGTQDQVQQLAGVMQGQQLVSQPAPVFSSQFLKMPPIQRYSGSTKEEYDSWFTTFSTVTDIEGITGSRKTSLFIRLLDSEPLKRMKLELQRKFNDTWMTVEWSLALPIAEQVLGKRTGNESELINEAMSIKQNERKVDDYWYEKLAALKRAFGDSINDKEMQMICLSGCTDDIISAARFVDQSLDPKERATAAEERVEHERGFRAGNANNQNNPHPKFQRNQRGRWNSNSPTSSASPAVNPVPYYPQTPRNNTNSPPLDQIRCYNCNEMGHYASSCPSSADSNFQTPSRGRGNGRGGRGGNRNFSAASNPSNHTEASGSSTQSENSGRNEGQNSTRAGRGRGSERGGRGRNVTFSDSTPDNENLNQEN